MNLTAKLTNVIASNNFFYFSLLLFLVQALFFALFIKVGLPPDENSHLGLTIYFYENGFNPFLEQTSDFGLGDVERQVSYLYSLLLSFVYALSPLAEEVTVYLLRIINVGFGLGTLIMLRAIGKRLNLASSIINFAVFMTASTLMFAFLSAAVNYDNLVILISMSSFYMVILLAQNFTARRLLGLAILVIFGSLIKYTYLPLAVVFTSVGIYFAYKNVPKLKLFVVNLLERRSWHDIVLVVLFAVLLALAVERIGGNIYNYSSINPNCDVVHSSEECESQALYRRNQMMLENRPSESTLMNPIEFASKWVITNTTRTYGIFAHETLEQPTPILVLISIFLLLTQFAVLGKIRPKKEPLLALLYGVSILYIFIVAYVNYGLYTTYGRFSLALQGRYTFLVLPVFYLVSLHYLKQLLPKYYPAALLLGGAVLFVSTLPVFLLFSDINWYNQLGNELMIFSLKGK